MKKAFGSEFVYQAAALLVSIIVVHVLYITIVRPNADAILRAQDERVAAGETFVPARSIYIVLKDWEQESCFILMFWAFAIMGYKGRTALRERALLEQRIVNVSEGMSILPEDAREYARPIQALPEDVQRYLLPRTLLAALQRFASTRNVQDVSEAVKSICDVEADRLDSELAMIRYIAWAIPAIGFIGTVTQHDGRAVERAVEQRVALMRLLDEARRSHFDPPLHALTFDGHVEEGCARVGGQPRVGLVVELLLGVGDREWVESRLAHEAVGDEIDPRVEQRRDRALRDVLHTRSPNLITPVDARHDHAMQRDVDVLEACRQILRGRGDDRGVDDPGHAQTDPLGDPEE